jgi:hypothetical protein
VTQFLDLARLTRQQRQSKPSAVQTVRTRHKGVVVTVSPLTLHLDGDTTTAVPAHLLGGYTPVINDVVFVDNEGGAMVVINKYVS